MLLAFESGADERGLDALLDVADSQRDGLITYRAFARCLTGDDLIHARHLSRHGRPVP